MSIQSYPCGDCPDCTPIGEGDGFCQYSPIYLIVKLCDVCPYCPKPLSKKDDTV